LEQRYIFHQEKNYLIIDDTLYRFHVDSILHSCVTDEEEKFVLNESNNGACGGHLSGLVKTQKILHTKYFWPTIFKDCIEVVKKFHQCQIFTRKKHTHPASLFPIIIVNPFTKWGVDFMTCHPPSTREHRYIILVIDYFRKWAEAMPTFFSDGEIITFFIFNQVITRCNGPK
jgi:hypothetical protein